MADGSNQSFPWATIAVIAAFVSSVYYVPQAFERMRPAEKERAQPAALTAELEVDARLWEDPFTSVRRHEAERRERCEKQKSSPPRTDCDATQVAQRRAPATVINHLQQLAHRADVEQLGPAAPVLSSMPSPAPPPRSLLVAVLVPGNPFVGAEESRMRTRYAVLAGLLQQGFAPGHAERIGLVEFDWRSLPAAGAPPGVRHDRFIAPFETLVRRPPFRGQRNDVDPLGYASVAVLWVDETALPAPKLHGLARMIADVFGATKEVPSLAVIGPSSSDALRMALADLDAAAKKPARLSPAERRGYAHLAAASFLSPAATVSVRDLLVDGKTDPKSKKLSYPRSDDELEQHLMRQFAHLQTKDTPARLLSFRRTIAHDAKVMKALVSEVRLRLPTTTRRRIVLVAERDSLYAQALVAEFTRRMAAEKWPRSARCGDDDALAIDNETRPLVSVVYFYRGLDGVTLREGTEAKPTESKGARERGAIEWPEGRHQLDYLRRLALSLERSEAKSTRTADSQALGKEKDDSVPIGAIGVFANDVHDKLLVLQALRENFPDKLFFTTDLDARLLHPNAIAFTRNLVVASSLPLEFAWENAKERTPALRDVYQSSAYVAARSAACRTQECLKEGVCAFSGCRRLSFAV